MENITIKDIAEICGVGVSTVSRAINNHLDINPQTKAKILATIEEYNYVPNGAARNLKRTESDTIGVIAKSMDNSFFGKFISVFEREINKKGYDYFLQHVDENGDEVKVAEELLRERKVKGVIFLGGYFVGAVDRLKGIDVPFVMSTIEVEELGDVGMHACASINDRKESYNIVNYLLNLGHKKIAIIAGEKKDQSIGLLREQGYRKAMKEASIDIKKEWIRYMKDGYESYSIQMGYEVTKTMLEEGVDVTAVFAISDAMAIGCCKAILDTGKKIPEDISVVGFDGMDTALYYNPSITTIKQPVKDIAKASTQLLFEMIEDEKVVDNKLFAGELLVGDSTGRCKLDSI